MQVKKKNRTKYYVIWRGRKPGIYKTWEECSAQIMGFPNASYRTYPDESMAMEAFALGSKPPKESIVPVAQELIKPSIVVNVDWDDDLKEMSYRGVLTETGEEIFKQGPFRFASKHIGEFLGVVHALAYCKKQGLDLPVYSESEVALSWVLKRKHNSKVKEGSGNGKLLELLARADAWLLENAYNNQIMKWENSR